MTEVRIDPMPRAAPTDRAGDPSWGPVAIALSLVVYGTSGALAIRAGVWRARAAITETSAEAAFP
jgi:hypothetical protein